MQQLLRRVKRVFDSRSIAAHLYVTERCNLRCGCCTEYDNSVPHPTLDYIRRWIGHLAGLGCLRIGPQRGEPWNRLSVYRTVGTRTR